MQNHEYYYILTEYLTDYIDLSNIDKHFRNFSEKQLQLLIENLKHGLQKIHKLRHSSSESKHHKYNV